MRTPACIGILILHSLCIFVRSYDMMLNPSISDVSIYPQICFMDNKPFYCLNVAPAPDQAYLPYAIKAGRQGHTYDSYTTKASPYMDLSLMSLKGTLDLRRRPPFYYSPQKYWQSSPQHARNPQIHRSFLYDSPPLEHGKYNYEVTTVKNEIKPSSDYLILLPSRSNVEAVSKSTTAVPLMGNVSKPDRESDSPVNVSLFDKFTLSLDRFERKFYQTTFNKLLSISPPGHLENGISFAQSSLFLYLALTALSTEVDSVSSTEIDSNLLLQSSDLDKIKLLKQIISWLPTSSLNLKFRWATRLVLEPGLPVSQKFLERTAPALKLQVEWLNETATLGNLSNILNKRVKTDSGGAMRNTFEEDDFSEGACSILLNTIYFRARWRSPPTVLNGSRLFRDSEHTQTQRPVRMIRINDIMRYAALEEWNAEALEIRYATPGLTVMLLVPQGHSLRSLATNMTTTGLQKIDRKMRSMRVAAILPIYTLRMTLLLPGKLKTMGISRIIKTNNIKSSGCGELRLSHAVQRIMFWAEAGRNAYKDDGIEWDEAPEREIIVDRPYLFFVRWKNVTLLNGNFAL